MGTFLYLDIATTLRGRITRGEYAQGRMPSERTLTTEFGVQRATVRRALETLEREGLVFRDATRGTFTAPRRGVPQTGGLGLVVGRARDTSAPGDIARGLGSVAETEARGVVWLDTPASPGRAEAAVPQAGDLVSRGVAGVAIWPELPADPERLRSLRDAMPLVLLDRRVPGFEADFVGVDDFAGGRLVAEHLLRIGHRRIGFLSGAPQAGTVQARVRGYAAALAAAGVLPRPEWVLHQEGGIAALDPALLTAFLEAGGTPPTAVICGNDTVAAGLMRFLRVRGRRVPDDVAVTGFGNGQPPLLEALGLTTVTQPFEEIGRAAGQILLARLRDEGSRALREVELPVSLVVRGSCGASPRLEGESK